MKYFVSDDHWDIEGYWSQLRNLESRFSKETFKIISNHSFHDADVVEFTILNTSIIRRTLDPTTVRARLRDIDGYEYELNWVGVNQIELSFSGRKKLYYSDKENDYYLTDKDRRGLEEWAYDELTSFDPNYLFHEITLHSGAWIKLLFRKMTVKRIRRWHDFS
ncbi:hypothetical protein [Cohnella caldifontis]|uniref:hypothetical protein n=1 Tax=Cohnella caldifontis TaxID=3027471 RepID=UPI0023ED4FCA|nr:hypothetical protein [Cohnella sp. YIM B05605]